MTSVLGTVLVSGRTADEGLAGLSDSLVYSAMVVYAVALVAFAVDLAGGRRGRSAEPATATAATASWGQRATQRPMGETTPDGAVAASWAQPAKLTQ